MTSKDHLLVQNEAFLLTLSACARRFPDVVVNESDYGIARGHVACQITLHHLENLHHIGCMPIFSHEAESLFEREPR